MSPPPLPVSVRFPAANGRVMKVPTNGTYTGDLVIRVIRGTG